MNSSKDNTTTSCENFIKCENCKLIVNNDNDCFNECLSKKYEFLKTKNEISFNGFIFEIKESISLLKVIYETCIKENVNFEDVINKLQEENQESKLFSLIKIIINELKGKITINNKLHDTLKISQNHSTNTAKGIFPNLIKDRLSKDSNYKVSKKENYYIVEYQTKTGIKKEYKTTIGIKDVPTIKIIDDITFNKFFTFIHYQFNVNNNYLFSFNSSLFLEFLGKENQTRDQKKRINAKINKYCKNILSHIQLKWEKRGNQSKTITPFPNVGIKNSIVTISLEVSYADELKNSFYEVPKEIGQLSENAYLIADYIYIYARNVKKDEFNLTKKTLYKKTSLPTYEEVKNGAYDRNTNKAIKEPFHKALMEIIKILNHKLIVDYKKTNTEKWEDFLKEKINFKILDYGNTIVSMKKAHDKKIKNTQNN